MMYFSIISCLSLSLIVSNKKQNTMGSLKERRWRWIPIDLEMGGMCLIFLAKMFFDVFFECFWMVF